MEKKSPSITLYLAIYVALLVLLALTVGVSFIDLGRHTNNLIAVIIACTKATLIILFFMHIRYERWVTWFFAGAGFFWLCILLTLSMTDYLTRNDPPHSSPKGEPAFLSPPAGNTNPSTPSRGVD